LNQKDLLNVYGVWGAARQTTGGACEAE